MKSISVQIIETVGVIILYIVLYVIIKKTINNFLKNNNLQRGRRKLIIKAITIFNSFAAILFISAIWGLKQNQIAVFASSILAAIGIAVFAQWSLLANITSSIILFFNHPLKIGDTIEIVDKEFAIIGEITDLTYFFVHIKSKNGATTTIPNSIMLQKSITINPNID